MDKEVATIKDRAEEGRALYRSGQIERNEAQELIMPYLNAVNSKAKEIAKKYNVRPKSVAFRSFVR